MSSSTMTDSAADDAPQAPPLLLEHRGRVCWITLNRPESLNAINWEMIRAFQEVLDQVERDTEARVLVLAAAGRAFCAGVDLKFVGSLGDASIAENVAFLMQLHALLNRIEAFPKPVIAAVNGLALAGGLEMVLCCDLVVAAESARFGDAHANYGLIPSAGGSVRLPRRIGVLHAKELMFTGEFWPAAKCAEIGLVNRVVPDDELAGAVAALADVITEKSPLGLARMKRLVDDSLAQPLDSALRAELAVSELHCHSDDLREGLQAFKEKRRPRFSGS